MSASGPGRITTLTPRTNRTPSTIASGWPAAGSGRSGGSVGGASVSGSRISTRPCSAMMSSGVAAAARSIISRTAGSARSISARSASLSTCTWSSSASSISVESNRPPRLSGAIWGWSGSTYVVPSTASSCLGRQHRIGVDARRGAVERRAEPAGGDSHEQLRRDQRPGQRAGAVEPGRRLARVVHAAAHDRRPVAPRLRAQRQPPAVELAWSRVRRPAPARARPGARRPRWRSPLGAR